MRFSVHTGFRYPQEGEVVGSVGFLIPEFRWTSSPQDAVVKALVNATARMSRQLGHAGPVPPA